MRKVAALPDPVGQVDHGWRMANGLRVSRMRVPFGVIAVVYESRPYVATDAAALCLASGNAVILRGSRSARRSNRILAEVMAGALIEAGVPQAAVSLLGTDEDELLALVRMERDVDLVIARGGDALRETLAEHARVPVLAATSGNNHVYVDAERRPRDGPEDRRQRQGPAAGGEQLRRDAPGPPGGGREAFLPQVLRALRAQGVEVRVSKAGLEALGEEQRKGVAEATEADFATEFLSLVMAVRVVDSLDEAVAHIDRHGSGHSEAIVTASLAAAAEFQTAVDAACVYVNASTRFTDGGEFGMGAEIANSTGKLHARGPIGLTELTTIKYLVTGDGQVR